MSAEVPFVRVVPEEIERYGFAGATFVAHIRYRCTTDGPGRFVVDGVRWWKVTLTGLAAELHVSKDVAQRAMKRLGDAVAANRFGPPSDQTYAYHVAPYVTGQNAESHRPDLPERDSAPVSDTDAESHRYRRGIAPVPTRNRTGTDAKARSVPLSGEGEEGGEGGENGARDDAPPSAPVNSEPATPDPHPVRNDPPNPELFLDENNNQPAPTTPGEYDPFDYGDDDDDPDGAPATEPAPAEVVDAEVVDTDPDPEPQRYCDRHMPDGTDNSCGACRNRRLVHEAWERRQPAPVRGQSAKVAGWVALGGGGGSTNPPPALPKPARRCPWCHDTGLVLMSDGTPGSDPSACNHDNTRRPATPEDIAEYERRRRPA